MFSEGDLIFRIPEQSILEKARGGFKRLIWVLVAERQGQPDSTGFLSKILTATQLNLEKDTLFVEIPTDKPTSVLPALKEKHGEFVLVFGLSPADIGLKANIPAYQPYLFYGSTFLFADALSVLEPDKTLKGKLWQGLQQMFL